MKRICVIRLCAIIDGPNIFKSTSTSLFYQKGFINKAVVRPRSFVKSSSSGALLRNIASLCPANTPERKNFSSFHDANSSSKFASITS